MTDTPLQCAVADCYEPWIYDAVCLAHWEELRVAVGDDRSPR